MAAQRRSARGRAEAAAGANEHVKGEQASVPRLSRPARRALDRAAGEPSWGPALQELAVLNAAAGEAGTDNLADKLKRDTVADFERVGEWIVAGLRLLSPADPDEVNASIFSATQRADLVKVLTVGFRMMLGGLRAGVATPPEPRNGRPRSFRSKGEAKLAALGVSRALRRLLLRPETLREWLRRHPFDTNDPALLDAALTLSEPAAEVDAGSSKPTLH
jgi:hypothetical protein